MVGRASVRAAGDMVTLQDASGKVQVRRQTGLGREVADDDFPSETGRDGGPGEAMRPAEVRPTEVKHQRPGGAARAVLHDWDDHS